MEFVTLNNGVKMPKLGYGVYQVDPAECERCVLDAISVGYRSIDTAQAYNNEEGVGAAIAKCGVPREELFITTKVWISNAGYEKAKASIDFCHNRKTFPVLNAFRYLLVINHHDGYHQKHAAKKQSEK